MSDLHLCRVRHCVNPAHLEVVTHLENMRRGVAPTMLSKLSGKCFKGHAMTPENTYVKPKSGYRQCRVCLSEYRRSYRAKGTAA